MHWAAAAVVLLMTTSAGIADEATVLAEVELDSITAAGVVLDVSSIAAALGDSAIAKTQSDTFAFEGRTLDLAVGITMGQALACCGEDAHVQVGSVGSVVVGIGDIVHGATQAVKHDSRTLVYGLSAGLVLTISPEKYFATVRDEPLAVLHELGAALADFHFELPGAVMVGAQ